MKKILPMLVGLLLISTPALAAVTTRYDVSARAEDGTVSIFGETITPRSVHFSSTVHARYVDSTLNWLSGSTRTYIQGTDEDGKSVVAAVSLRRTTSCSSITQQQVSCSGKGAVIVYGLYKYYTRTDADLSYNINTVTGKVSMNANTPLGNVAISNMDLDYFRFKVR